MKDTVVILGSHPDTRGEFDFSRQDCDVWVFNEAAAQGWVKRADAVFQMHLPAIWRNPHNRNDKNHYAWLSSGNTPPVYMMEVYPDVPRSVRYPIEDVQKALLSNFNHPKYFTSSVCYALALAIYLGYRRIEMYGVEMETGTEYASQRPGVAFWVGLAVGRGIEVEVHCRMFSEPMYGYEGDISLGIDVFQRRIHELNEQCQAHHTRYQDARARVTKMLHELVNHNVKLDDLVKSIQEQALHAANFGYMDGARQENERYLKKMEAMIKVGGVGIIVRQEYEQSMIALAKSHQASVMAANALAGQAQTALEQITTTRNPKKRIARLNRAVEIIGKFIEETTKSGMYLGAAEENHRYMQQLDALIRAAGGKKSEEVLLAEVQHAVMA